MVQNANGCYEDRLIVAKLLEKEAEPDESGLASQEENQLRQSREGFEWSNDAVQRSPHEAPERDGAWCQKVAPKQTMTSQ